jgi:hypothetical protein
VLSNSRHLARPSGAADRSALVAGDSATAKSAVTRFVDSIGYATAYMK